jgi:hypothetical protein
MLGPRRQRPVLPYENACRRWEERPQQKNQEVQVKHPRQDQVGIDLPDHTHKTDSPEKNSAGVEFVHLRVRWQLFTGTDSPGDDAQVDGKAIAGQRPSEVRHHALRSTTSQVGDE